MRFPAAEPRAAACWQTTWPWRPQVRERV